MSTQISIQDNKGYEWTEVEVSNDWREDLKNIVGSDISSEEEGHGQTLVVWFENGVKAIVDNRG